MNVFSIGVHAKPNDDDGAEAKGGYDAQKRQAASRANRKGGCHDKDLDWHGMIWRVGCLYRVVLKE